MPECVSSDSRLVAVSMEPNDAEFQSAAIKLFAAPDWKEIFTLVDKVASCDARTFAMNDRVLVGSVGKMNSKHDYQSIVEDLKLWDVATGEEILSVVPPDGTKRFGWMIASPDGQFVAANAYNLNDKDPVERVVLVDITRRTSVAIALPRGEFPGKPVFHPSGNWLAVKSQVNHPGRDLEAEEIEQPRVLLMSVPDGKVHETLIAPQCFLSSMAFSPDGTTLATSGPGAVLLWDFRTPPGVSGP